jgi:hypothetical protein
MGSVGVRGFAVVVCKSESQSRSSVVIYEERVYELFKTIWADD